MHKYGMNQYGNVDIMHEFSDRDLEDLLVVPEDVVELCSDTMLESYGPDAENNFALVLQRGAVLKDNGRTPVYLCTQDMTHIYVTSVERLKKQYH